MAGSCDTLICQKYMVLKAALILFEHVHKNDAHLLQGRGVDKVTAVTKLQLLTPQPFWSLLGFGHITMRNVNNCGLAT